MVIWNPKFLHFSLISYVLKYNKSLYHPMGCVLARSLIFCFNVLLLIALAYAGYGPAGYALFVAVYAGLEVCLHLF